MKQPLSVFEVHQLKIAKDTLKMSNAMVGVMGGMTKKEAKEIVGWGKLNKEDKDGKE